MKCPACGINETMHKLSWLCRKCSEIRARRRADITRRSHKAVEQEILAGRLPPVKNLACVDCGEPAVCYDHRDYSKPIDVDAVCKSCDASRGPGAPYDGADKRWARRQRAPR